MKAVRDIASDVDGVELHRGDPDTPVASIAADSRDVGENTLFVAIEGQRVDGHDFIGQAVESGASAVLIDRHADCDVPDEVAVFRCDDTRSSLGLVASWFFEYPSRHLDVIGVTGTNGKTSTSYLLEQIFTRAGRSPGIIGTVEYRWNDQTRGAPNTTPNGLILQRTLREMADDGVEVAIVEVSSHGLENGRVAGTRFAAGLFTNLSRDHLGFHGSFDAYRRAKWRLFVDYLPASKTTGDCCPPAVVNIDDAQGQRLFETLVEHADVPVVSHSIQQVDVDGGDTHFFAEVVDLSLDGIRLAVDEGNQAGYEVFVPLPGRFNAENALGAVAVARRLGVARNDVVEGLTRSDGIPGRMERVGVAGDGPATFVDYAHTPDALEQALQTLRPLTRGQLWVVFGAGGDRDTSKRAPMGRVAMRGADRVVVTSDNPRSEPPDRIIDEIVEGIRTVESDDRRESNWIRRPDRRVAIEEAILRAGRSDAILIAGKGHERYQEQQGRRRDFDDRRVANNAFRLRGEGQCDD